MLPILQLPGPLIDVSWLRENGDDVVILDTRWYLDGRSGRAEYDSGHIPGARFVDLDVDLASPPTRKGGRHPLPSPTAFAATMGRLGVATDSVVVTYDDNGGIYAARCWWMLDAIGVAAAVLDGGIAEWDHDLETVEPSWDPVEFDARSWPEERLITIDAVAALSGDPGTLILDARSVERYRGDENPIDERFGHVPGAASAPCSDNLGADGLMLAPEQLAARYADLGAVDRDVVAYCGSGVSACHDLLAMRIAGLDEGRLFVGSWSAWGADHDRPVETGP